MELSQYNRADFKDFVQDHLKDDPALLLFKYQGKVTFDIKAAVQQISARQKAAKKLPTWCTDPRLIFPTSISLEQSSSEATAMFKSRNLEGNAMIDLTGGFGVDSFFLSRGFEQAVYCEKQEDLAAIVSFNLSLLSPYKFTFIKGDGLTYLKNSIQYYNLIYADPARRGTGNQKLYRLQDCEPNVVSNWDLMMERAEQIMLKVSPMLDVSQALTELPSIQKIQILSVRNEVKELILLWNRATKSRSVQLEVVDLGEKEQHFVFSQEEEARCGSQYGEVENYLVEPLSGILKAGAFKSFGKRFGLKKLEANSHLYTCSHLPSAVPGRVFEVLEEISPKKENVRKFFPTGKVNVITRNYSSGAEELKKKLRVQDGGEDFLIGTKTLTGFKLFWCRKFDLTLSLPT